MQRLHGDRLWITFAPIGEKAGMRGLRAANASNAANGQTAGLVRRMGHEAAINFMQMLRVCLAMLVVCFGCTKASGAYAHYFTWHGAPNETQLRQCLAEMRQIIDNRRDLVVGQDGPGSAIFVDQLNLNFNGFGNDAQGRFIFPGALGYNSCRTDRNAYDMVVTACLLVARDHFTDLELGIASDGSWEAGDWAAGAKLYSSVLNRPALSPIGGRGDITHWFKKSFVIPVLLVLAFGIWRWWSNRNQEAG